LLPAGMEITPYNHHAKTPFFPASLSSTQDYRVRIEPSLLSNQFKPSFGLSGYFPRAPNP
jgi:hypothetical protein